MRRLTQFLLPAVLCAAPLTAQAQFGTTTGFPLGEKSRIHTGVDMSVGYDSNSKRFDTDNAPQDGQLGDWLGIIRPSIGVNVPGSSVELDLLGQANIMRYFGTGSEPAENEFGGNITTKLRLGSPDSFLGFMVENQVVRTPVFLDEAGTIASNERRFKMWHNRGEALFTLRPGGRALEFDLGYGLLANMYDTLPTGLTHSGIFEARWKFFPKTAFVFHGDIGTFTPGTNVANNTKSALPIHVYMGAVGQVTARLNAEITAGYGDTLTEGGGASSKRGPIGNLILTYVFGPDTRLSVGYRRQIQPEVVVNAVSSDTPFVNFTVGLMGRLRLSLYGSYQFRRLGEFQAQTLEVVDPTSAQIAVADARAEYWFFSWLNASIGYRLQSQSVADAATVPSGGLATAYLQDFSRHQVYFNLGLRY